MIPIFCLFSVKFVPEFAVFGAELSRLVPVFVVLEELGILEHFLADGAGEGLAFGVDITLMTHQVVFRQELHVAVITVDQIHCLPGPSLVNLQV